MLQGHPHQHKLVTSAVSVSFFVVNLPLCWKHNWIKKRKETAMPQFLSSATLHSDVWVPLFWKFNYLDTHGPSLPQVSGSTGWKQAHEWTLCLRLTVYCVCLLQSALVHCEVRRGFKLLVRESWTRPAEVQRVSSNGCLCRRNTLDLEFLLRYVILDLSGKQFFYLPYL